MFLISVVFIKRVNGEQVKESMGVRQCVQRQGLNVKTPEASPELFSWLRVTPNNARDLSAEKPHTESGARFVSVN